MRAKEKYKGIEYEEARRVHDPIVPHRCIDGSQEWYELIESRELLEEFEEDERRRDK